MPPNPADLSLQVAEEGGRVTVRFPSNTMLCEANSETFARELGAVAGRKEGTHLLIDLGGVTMLTSVILAKLVAPHSRLRAAGGRLTLLHATPTVFEVFKVTRLDTFLEITPA